MLCTPLVTYKYLRSVIRLKDLTNIDKRKYQSNIKFAVVLVLIFFFLWRDHNIYIVTVTKLFNTLSIDKV